MDTFTLTEEALALAQRSRPLFAGHGQLIQGAALCELVATHFASHVVPGDRKETAKMRRELLAVFIRTVEQLIPVIDDDVVQPELKRRAQ